MIQANELVKLINAKSRYSVNKDGKLILRLVDCDTGEDDFSEVDGYFTTYGMTSAIEILL